MADLATGEFSISDEVEIDKHSAHIFETEDDAVFEAETQSYQCLAQVAISRSSVLRHPLYPFPSLKDPGITDAFNYKEPEAPVDRTGCDVFRRKCSEMNIVPITRVFRSLPTDTLNMKFYGLTDTEFRAIMEALKTNYFVRTLILDNNYLSSQAFGYLNQMLPANHTLKNLHLRHCNIGPVGAYNLGEALENSQQLTTLDISFNGLGNEGLKLLQSALEDNFTITSLNLSHNGLDEDSVKILARILTRNNNIESLDLSWNSFCTQAGNKVLFAALTDNTSVRHLNFAWNGLSARETVVPVNKYLKNTEVLEELDLSSNKLAAESIKLIRAGVQKCPSLASVNLTNITMTPNEAIGFLKIFTAKPKSPFRCLNMSTTFVTKDSVPLIKRLRRQGKAITIGGVIGDYTIKGPDTLKLLFARAKFLAMKVKKKKAQKDFGHFILQLPKEDITKQQFEDLVKKFKMKKVDKDLVVHIMEKFQAKKQKIDVVGMRDSYMSYYPETELPPPKPKKGKGKKAKKAAKGEASPEGEVPVEGQPPDKAQAADEQAPKKSESAEKQTQTESKMKVHQ